MKDIVQLYRFIECLSKGKMGKMNTHMKDLKQLITILTLEMWKLVKCSIWHFQTRLLMCFGIQKRIIFQQHYKVRVN